MCRFLVITTFDKIDFQKVHYEKQLSHSHFSSSLKTRVSEHIQNNLEKKFAKIKMIFY